MKAILTNYRQSPRKVRLVANFLKGKNVANAEAELGFLTKRAALPIKKLIDSAVANAKANFNINKEDLVIENVIVDKGIVMRRIMPRARGSASRINKRTSHVTVMLKEKK
jgi:large subunit ribosomal protein L22